MKPGVTITPFSIPELTSGSGVAFVGNDGTETSAVVGRASGMYVFVVQRHGGDDSAMQDDASRMAIDQVARLQNAQPS